MPDFISDPSTRHYLVLLVFAVLPLLAAYLLTGQPPRRADGKHQRPPARRILIGLSALMFLLIVGLMIADRSYESDREQIVRKLEEMSAGVRERDMNKVFSHVSEKFRLGTADKARLRSAAESAQQRGEVTEIPFWDINIESLDKEAGKAVVDFRFKVNGNRLGENQFICEATFAREADLEWRLISFRVFPPTGKRDEYAVPGLQ